MKPVQARLVEHQKDINERNPIKAIVRSQNNLSRVLAPGTWGHPWRLVLLQNEEKLSIILNSHVL